MLVDESLLPLLETFRDRAALPPCRRGRRRRRAPRRACWTTRRSLAAAPEPLAGVPEPDERDAAAMCYTSGTTGRSKGVVYSHRALVLHSMATAMAGSFAISAADIVLAVIPMFHANAWGLPFTAALTGAGLVFPGPHLEPASLLELCHAERVTFSAGVPTVWLGVLERARRLPGQVRSLRASDDRDRRRRGAGVAGARARGAARPPGDHLVGHDRDRAGRHARPAHARRRGAAAGRAARAPDEAGAAGRAARAPGSERARARCRWDGVTMGELEVRGAYVASAYYRPEEDGGWFTADGWFRTGDIASIDPRGYLEIRDRTKDLIKSGGEWISSVALEGALMGHPAVAEAAVVAVPHPAWIERPLAAVVLREGRTADAGGAARLSRATGSRTGGSPTTWSSCPAIPRTSTGKFLKSALRDFAARALRRRAEEAVAGEPAARPRRPGRSSPIAAPRRYAPENTLPAFELAVRQGADAFELDVRLTRDGAPVVIHDATLERTTDLTGPVRARTLAELRDGRRGHWFTPDGGRTCPFRDAGRPDPDARRGAVGLPGDAGDDRGEGAGGAGGGPAGAGRGGGGRALRAWRRSTCGALEAVPRGARSPAARRRPEICGALPARCCSGAGCRAPALPAALGAAPLARAPGADAGVRARRRGGSAARCTSGP